MPSTTDSRASMTPPAAPRRRKVGFLGHQLVEYVLGAALIATGVRVVGTATVLLIGIGFVVVVLAALTDGPLGATHLLSRRVHHVLDLVVAGALMLSPLLSLRHPNGVAIGVAEIVAVLLIRIERGTDYRKAPVRPGISSGAAPGVAPGGASATGVAPATGVTPATADELAGAWTASASARGAPEGSRGAPGVDAPGALSSKTAELAAAAGRGAAAAGRGAAVASAVASQLAPVAAKAAHRSAFHLGLMTGVARRAARQHGSSPAKPSPVEPVVAPGGGSSGELPSSRLPPGT